MGTPLCASAVGGFTQDVFHDRQRRHRLLFPDDEHLRTLQAYILSENIEMQKLMQKVGFRISRSEDPAVLLAILEL